MGTLAINRRKLIKAGTIAGAGALLGAPSVARAQAPGTETADYCVVGAGYAGLTAALRLKQANKSVIVLEARPRVGGRTRTETRPAGGWIDYGGQWIGPGQDRIGQLAKDFGVETYPSYHQGNDVCYADRFNWLSPGLTYDPQANPIPPVPGLEPIVPALVDFSVASEEVPLDKPWTTNEAYNLDHATVWTWMTTNRFKTQQQLSMFQYMLSGLPVEASLLFALWALKACGGFAGIGTAQQTRFVGGGQAVANQIAANLGAAIRLSSPVRRIAWNSDDSVTVVSDTVTVSAKRVIVAIPPTLISGITFDPVLPSDRAQLIQRLPQAAVWKFLVFFDTPFWRARGLSGSSVRIDLANLAHATADSGFPTEGPYKDIGVLAVFAHNDQARSLATLDRAARRQEVLNAIRYLASPYPTPAPRDFYEGTGPTSNGRADASRASPHPAR